jgi:hypothetical protein
MFARKMEKTMMTTRIEAKTAFDQEEVNQGHCHQWDFREVLLGDFVRPDFGGLALVMQSKGEICCGRGHYGSVLRSLDFGEPFWILP